MAAQPGHFLATLARLTTRYTDGMHEKRGKFQVFASIRDRPTWITGWPHSWWGSAEPSEPGARQLPFGFDITNDGAGSYLLVCFSADGAYAADTWHESLDDAYSAAEAIFGVRRSEWQQPISRSSGIQQHRP
jgi:hypothetical protein